MFSVRCSLPSQRFIVDKSLTCAHGRVNQLCAARRAEVSDQPKKMMRTSKQKGKLWRVSQACSQRLPPDRSEKLFLCHFWNVSASVQKFSSSRSGFCSSSFKVSSTT